MRRPSSCRQSHSTELQPPLTHTSKVQCCRHIPICDRVGGERRGRWKRKNDLQKYSPAAPLAVCGTAHPKVGSELQREGEGNGYTAPSFLLRASFSILHAWAGSCLLHSNRIKSIPVSYACKQASEAAGGTSRLSWSDVQKELLLPSLLVSFSGDEPDFQPRSHKMLYTRGMSRRGD